MKQIKKIVVIREDIKEAPTKQEKELILQYGQKLDNKCLDCSKPLYYFNQCDSCYSKMIACAKL